MGIDIDAIRAQCYKCGKEYGRHKGYFPVSYAVQHKGMGYIPVCKTCIDDMYNGYLSQCNDVGSAVRQTCRKLDLYWSESVYDLVSKKSTNHSMMTQYIAKINSLKYAGKSYDDTLSEEGSLWDFIHDGSINFRNAAKDISFNKSEYPEITEEMLSFWGGDYSPDMYEILEKKFSYYKSNIPQNTFDIGTEKLLRQICILEAIIDRDSAAGKPVEKSINTYNTLIGSLNLKPAQKREDLDQSAMSTPFGVWINRWENERPIPEVDPELKDIDGIKKYICVWFFGHLCKMLGIKNLYSKLYDEEIEKFRVERPEFDDEDEEDMIYDAFKDIEADDKK